MLGPCAGVENLTTLSEFRHISLEMLIITSMKDA
jgi:hypothetical protein